MKSCWKADSDFKNLKEILALEVQLNFKQSLLLMLRGVQTLRPDKILLQLFEELKLVYSWQYWFDSAELKMCIICWFIHTNDKGKLILHYNASRYIAVESPLLLPLEKVSDILGHGSLRVMCSIMDPRVAFVSYLLNIISDVYFQTAPC